jgi:hypothetical protein
MSKIKYASSETNNDSVKNIFKSSMKLINQDSCYENKKEIKRISPNYSLGMESASEDSK